MKKIILFIFIITFPVILFSQDLYIPDNPYDKADDYTKTRNAFNRERWFYEQRMFPYNFIPAGVYEKAHKQKLELKNSQGYFMNSNNWVSLGPTPGYYFNYGNICSRITTVKFDPVNPNIIYIGAAFGGVWKSTDGGYSWVPKTDFEVSLSSGALAIDPTNTNTVYYGTGEATYSGASYYGRGLLKSTDAGETWTSYKTGLPDLTYFSRLVIKPGNPNFLLAALGNSGLYKSTDAGESWIQAVSGRCDDVIFSPDGITVYIIGSGSQYRISTNGGSSFTTVSSGITLGTRNHIAICKSYPNVLYASTYTSSGNVIKVYKSTNSGYNFTELVNTFSGTSQAWYDFYMHVSPYNPDFAYVGLINIYRTTNGDAFTNISGSTVHVDQHNMDFHPFESATLIAVNDGGIWYSTNRGDTWSNRNSSLTLTQFYRIAADPSNPSHIIGGTQDNGTQRTTGSINYTAVYSGDGGEVCFHIKNPQYILGETQNNGVFRSTNQGLNWSSAASGLSGTGAWVGPLICHPDSAGIFYTARQQVFKTTNNAANWLAISSGTSGTIRELAISKSDPNIMYATVGSSLYKSTDRGYNFSYIYNTTLPSRTITSVNIHPEEPEIAILTYSGFGTGHIYRTTNGGTNWENISGNLPDSPAQDGLIYYPGYSTSIYLVGLDVGVFMTNNYGQTWIELADGLPNTVAMHLDFHYATQKIRIGTHGRGIWELNGTLTGIVNYNNTIPESYKLHQNYPNPFNPTTNIKFQILETENVKLSVYNSLGQEIKILVDERLNPGTYNVSFDGTNLSSGFYLYRLQTSRFSDTKKMVLIR